MRIVHQAVLSLSVSVFSLGSLTQAASAHDDTASWGQSKSAALQAKKCDDFEGTFSSVAVPACADSPVGLCTQGELDGELEGDYYFVFETLAPDPDDPSKLLYTGYSVITTNKGTLYTEDSGVVDAVPPEAPANLVTEAEIEYGTKKYRKSLGVFIATGVLQYGTAEGTYAATICKAKGKK